ncbi:hypothetical protein Sjap_007649 [Stephania japonica]|uniref:Uncharacterized protein n=1 Tax=Stephania japonica TaxID=461633 RepID=A0AAP0JQ83_9MAGN
MEKRLVKSNWKKDEMIEKWNYISGKWNGDSMIKLTGEIPLCCSCDSWKEELEFSLLGRCKLNFKLQVFFVICNKCFVIETL